MISRSFTVKVILGVLAFGTPAVLADATPAAAGGGSGQAMTQNGGGGMRPSGGGMRPGGSWDHHDRNNGNNFAYLPWVSGGFGPYYPADSTGPAQAQQQPPQTYDIAPAVGMAAYANAEFDNRWASLQVMVDRARKEFQISDQYLNAKKDLDNSQQAYDNAVDSVISRLQTDPSYKDLVLKRTQEQIALKSTGIDTAARTVVATDKMHYGSQVSLMEANALANDSSVQDARTKLVSADENLRLLEKRFEADLYHRPDVVAARQQMETARANKAGADGYLDGALITRGDQMYANDQTYTGNNVYLSGYDPFYRGYYGIGFGGAF